ncbi:hypothetical protein [Paenibacillus sp. Y412MC10]|uniref:hypothetical protein n=1 Tax=Geobacillus sp. (strain Y412MC10) TaxID=481743 RepID=UPI001C92D121|nr:hypothetical protein [Paenibacillus sp. Y412MC10]
MVTSTSGSELYMTELCNGTVAIQADVSPEKGGSGKHFRPHDLIEAGRKKRRHFITASTSPASWKKRRSKRSSA